jgi:hypothetical protein
MCRPRIHIGSLCLATVLGFFVWFYIFIAAPRQRHIRWHRAVELRILRLADKRPGDVTPAQWAACLHHTWNLHCNWGGFESFRPAARGRFLEEFDRRLAGPVGLGTIDWIWDQYCRHSGGKHYSVDYRPTTPGRLEEAALDRYRENELDQWLVRKQEREREDSGRDPAPVPSGPRPSAPSESTEPRQGPHRPVSGPAASREFMKHS